MEIKNRLFTAYLDKNDKAICVEYNKKRLPRIISMIFYKLYTTPEGVNRDDLIEYVWGDFNYFICRSFDVHFAKLKKTFSDNFEIVRIGRSSECLIKLKPKTNEKENSPLPTIG